MPITIPTISNTGLTQNILTISNEFLEALNSLAISSGSYRGIRFAIYQPNLITSFINNPALVSSVIIDKFKSATYGFVNNGVDSAPIDNEPLPLNNVLAIQENQYLFKNNNGIYKPIGVDGNMITPNGWDGAIFRYKCVVFGNNYQERVRILASFWGNSDCAGTPGLNNQYTLIDPIYGQINGKVYLTNIQILENSFLFKGATILIEFKAENSPSQIFTPSTTSLSQVLAGIANSVYAITNLINKVVINVNAFSNSFSSNNSVKTPQTIAKTFQTNNTQVVQVSNNIYAIMQTIHPTGGLIALPQETRTYLKTLNSTNVRGQLNNQITTLDKLVKSQIVNISSLINTIPVATNNYFMQNNLVMVQQIKIMQEALISYQTLLTQSIKYYVKIYNSSTIIKNNSIKSVRNILFSMGINVNISYDWAIRNKIIDVRNVPIGEYN